MQMEFLKLDKESENPLEELQSTHLSVCLSVCWYSLCVREPVLVHPSVYTSTTCRGQEAVKGSRAAFGVGQAVKDNFQT